MSAGGDALLQLDGISVHFGGVTALSEVGLAVRAGTLHGLIGPNGAGKTTLLNCISRLVEPQSGRMRFDGRDLLAVRAHGVASLGIARTFQNFGLIEELSALENVMAGMHCVHPGSIVDELLRPARRNAQERAVRERARAALALAGLADVESRTVSSLPYGTRKSVELARAIAVEPKLLLLDEPTAGLNEAEMKALKKLLLALRERLSLTMLVISHHLEFLLGAVDEITVLDLGRRIATGEPDAIRRDPAVIAAYIGAE